MSKLILLLLVLMGSFAHAVFRGPNEVVKAYCADAREEAVRMGGMTMTRICTASIRGQGAKFLTVSEVQATRPVRMQETVWQIKSERTTRDGVVVSVSQVGYVENGMFHKVIHVRASVGKVLIVKSRAGAPIQMGGELDGRKFKAADFRGVVRAL